MFTALAVVLVIASPVTILSLVGEEASTHQHAVYAQMQNQTQAPPTNFTRLFSTDQEFQLCIEDISIPVLPCVPVIEVLYEDPTLLVLQSNYIDTI
jgi:hypothetical protein